MRLTARSRGDQNELDSAAESRPAPSLRPHSRRWIMRPMPSRPSLLSVVLLACVALVSLGVNPCAHDRIELPGLSDAVSVHTDREGVWHIEAHNDRDLALA